MVGLAFASVGAAGATAAGSPCAAVGGTVGGPATILESVLGTAVGFGVAGLAEASVAGAGGTVLVEAVADALLDCVSAGATGALAATDRVRNTGMAGEPAWLPGACPAIDRVRTTGAAGAAGITGTGAAIGCGDDSGEDSCGGIDRSVGGIATTAGWRSSCCGSRRTGCALPQAGAAGTGAATAAVTGVALAAGAIAGATVVRTLVTMARAASGVFSGSAGRSMSAKTTPAPAVAPTAVATRTTRAVRAKLGVGAK